MRVHACRSEEAPALHESRPCWDAKGHWGAAHPLRRRYHDKGRSAARAASPSQSGVGYTLICVVNRYVVLKYSETYFYMESLEMHVFLGFLRIFFWLVGDNGV